MATSGYLGALSDFRRARWRATMESLLARLNNHPSQLLSYEDVRRITGVQGEWKRGLQEIPIENIVGSVGRYADFTRTFLPRDDSMKERWARVMALATAQEGWPPIEVYQIGDAYFVIDGHHRVSAARQMGLATFPAYVIETRARIPVQADDDLQQLILRMERHRFARRTRLEDGRPQADLQVTSADAYRSLVDHIDVHRYYMGLEERREIPYQEAAVHWYDEVYEPVAAIICQTDLLDEFPDRTETDLYLWLSDHRAQLEESLGRHVAPERAARDFKRRQDGRLPRRLMRIGNALRRALSTDLSLAS